MLVKCKFTIENKSQIFPRIFGLKNGASDRREVERRGDERSMRSRKMKDFSLRVFDSKTGTIAKFKAPLAGNPIETTGSVQ